MSVNPVDLWFAMDGRSPEDAKFYWSGGPVQVAERTWFQSQMSGVTAFETDEGLVLVDSGSTLFGSDLAEMLRSVTSAPVHTVIFTHGHIDHAYGLQYFMAEGQEPPRVVAHCAMRDRFERYIRTAGHNAALNARQGGMVLEAEQDIPLNWGEAPVIPPDTLYRDGMTLEVGGLTFELHHCRGETDDHTWVYCPERRVLCSGDLFIWAVPNAGNPQKVQRYPADWIHGLREMAALRPDSLCPGHGGPVVNNPDLIQRMLLETASFLESVLEQTLAVMNDGAPPHVDIVHRVILPVSESPWLQNIYDDAEFIIRNIIRQYGGWYSGRPSELKPAPRAELAQVIVGLAGGAKSLIQKSEALAAEGNYRLASHLADFALEAAPEDQSIRDAVADLYERRAGMEAGLMSGNTYRAAAVYARAGRPFS
jgi:glyoxylase-like metal-dependent hydrolase (beta-lactamase superfamily II)